MPRFEITPNLLTPQLLERFEAKIARSGPGPAACYLWTAGTASGYGRFKIDAKKCQAHRVAWVIEHGMIPDGLHVLHHCDVRPCVNVSHLFLGTNADNVADKVAKGRQARQRGEANGRAIVTKGQAIEIRTEYLALTRYPSGRIVYGHLAALGAEYGVRGHVIAHIGKGRNWKHLA